MVYFKSIISAAALLSTFAAARPMPDSSINEPAVSAPDGTPITAKEAAATSSWSSSAPAATAASAASSWTSSVVAQDSTWSSSVVQDSAWSSSAAAQIASTSTAAASSQTSSYGSGSSNWGGSGYNDCVNQCVAQFGSPAQSWTPTATSSSDSGSKGSGATITVIVAPTQGVLRFVPFAVNASIGDTVKFMWNANNHTVTKGSQLLPCNKTADALFTSGSQNKDFVFTQVVNSTDPTFYFCNTPGHCAKGMFGIINPPNAWASTSNVASQIGNMTKSSPDVAAMSSYSTTKCASNTKAAGWGKNIDLAGMPDWSHQAVIENTLYTRTVIAANPDIMSDNGVLDIGAMGSNPLMIPQDITVALSQVSSSSAPAAAATANTAAASSSAAPSSPAAAAAAQNNGAMSSGSSKILVGLTALAATFFLL